MLPRLLSLVSGQEWWWLIIVGCAILHHFAYCHKLLSLNSICTCLYHFEYVHCVWSCVPLPATLVVSIAFSQPPLVLHMRLNLSVYSEDATWKTAFGYSINVRSLIQWYPFNTNFSLLSTCLLLRRLNLLLQMEMKMKTSISYSYILFFFLFSIFPHLLWFDVQIHGAFGPRGLSEWKVPFFFPLLRSPASMDHGMPHSPGSDEAMRKK